MLEVSGILDGLSDLSKVRKLKPNIYLFSGDCPIFYRRVKAKKNLEESLKVLEDFRVQEKILSW